MARRSRRPAAAPAAPPGQQPSAAPAPPAPVLAAACSALVLLFLAVSITPLTNNDIWLHMANGEWILANGRVPLTDPYSFSAHGNRFYAHEWLAGVLFALTERAAGVNGLILLKTGLGAAALLLCAAAARRLGAGWTALLGCSFLALVIVNSRFLERPEMFSYALTGLYLRVMAAEHRRLRAATTAAPGGAWEWMRSSLLWALVPVQWIWVQIHGYYLTGLLLLGLFLTGAYLEQLAGPAPRRRGWPQTRLLSGAAALATMLLLGLVNPNGLEIYIFPFELAGGENIFMQTIFEWRPTFTTETMVRSSMFLGFCLWLALLLAGCLDAPALLNSRRLWRGAALLSAVVLLGIRVRLGGQPESSVSGLPASAWLWSPGQMLGSVTGIPSWRDAIDAALSPLRLPGAWGDDIFTLLLVGLLGWLAWTWRRPAAAALPLLVTAVTLIYQRAGEHAIVVLALTLGPALALAAWRRALPFWQLLVAVAFLGLAVKQNRNIVNFALVTLPVLAPALTRLGGALWAAAPAALGGARPRRAALPTAVLATLFALAALLTVTRGWPYTPRVVKEPGLGVGQRVPVEAVHYIRANGIGGRVFNKYAYGAYLIHELFPDSRVYMDSRNDVYGPDLYRTYLAALKRPEVTARVFAESDFDYVLVDYDFYPRRSEDEGLFSFLEGNPDWVLVYFDDTSVLYLRRRPEYAPLISRDGYQVLDPVRYVPGIASSLTPGELLLFIDESRRAQELRPDSVVALTLRLEALIAEGQELVALELAEGILEADPNNLLALITGARLARNLGRTERARELYRRALRIGPELDQVRREAESLGPDGVTG